MSFQSARIVAGRSLESELPRALLAASLLWVSLSALSPTPARAGVGGFLYGGASAITHEKTDLNEMLDEYTIRKESGGWEGGAGLRLFSRMNGATTATGDPRWEIRLRLGLSGGDLPGTTLKGRRSQYPFQYSYDFESRDSYSYRSWTLGGNFLVNVLPNAGFFVGPALQSVQMKAKRAWTGPTDCNECGDAKDQSTERYGMIEMGGRYKPKVWPVSFEGFAAPWRRPLSTTHILQSPNWTTANFPSFTRSFGARVVYEF